MDGRITFDAAWIKMGLHHDVLRTHLVDEVLAALKHFQRATSDYVFPSPKSGSRMSGFTKMVSRPVNEAGVAKFTMHDLRRSLRTIMSRCGYDNKIQRLCVGQKPRGIDQVYNHDEQWIIRKMAFEAAHDYIAELVGAKQVGKVVRLQRTNPLDPIKAEPLARLREHYAAGAAWWTYRIWSDSRALHRHDRAGGRRRNAISAGGSGRAATAQVLRACAG